MGRAYDKLRSLAWKINESPARFLVKHWNPRVDDTPMITCGCGYEYWRAKYMGYDRYKVWCSWCRTTTEPFYIPSGSVSHMGGWKNIGGSEVYLAPDGSFRARPYNYFKTKARGGHVPPKEWAPNPKWAPGKPVKYHGELVSKPERRHRRHKRTHGEHKKPHGGHRRTHGGHRRTHGKKRTHGGHKTHGEHRRSHAKKRTRGKKKPQGRKSQEKGKTKIEVSSSCFSDDVDG